MVVLFITIVTFGLIFFIRRRQSHDSIQHFQQLYNGPSNPTIVVFTRFSILDCDATNWKMSRNNGCDALKSKLFDEARLHAKFTVFEQMTLPSIVNQTYKNYKWIIYTNHGPSQAIDKPHLPEKWMDHLRSLTDPHANIEIHQVNNVKESSSHMNHYLDNQNGVYFSMRLDDDDALHPLFFQNLTKYANEPNGTIVSHYVGRNFTLMNDKIILGNVRFQKNIALGLAVKNDNIFNMGNHNYVNNRNDKHPSLVMSPVIYDSMKEAYRVFCSVHTDTNRVFY